MINDQGFANLIYEYFVVRFHFQYYKHGDSLPKTQILCQQFSVSPLTIKSAFKRLQAEGYISRNRGQSAKVLFQQNDKEFDQYAVKFFSERRDIIPDLYKSTELIVLPMLTKSLCSMNENDFAYLEKLVARPDPEYQIRFYCYILQKVQNPLIMNLFWESTLYFGLPFSMQHRENNLYDAEISCMRLKALITAGKKKKPECILQAHHAFQQDVSKKIHSYIVRHISAVPKTKQIPFIWKIYRDRPEICCNLAIRVIHDIYLGDFRDMEFLPSYEKMAEKYNVSVSTMRRTIRVLNQLGATQSINGIGTRVLMMSSADIEQELDLTVPKIQRNMAYYIQSFELLAQSSEGVMRLAFQAFSEAEKIELADLLDGYLHNGRYYISPQSIYAFVADHSPLQGIEEIYGKLYGLNLWGYPMRKYRKQIPGIDQDLIQFTKTVVSAIHDNNEDWFSMTISTFMQKEYRIAKEILIEHDFKPDDLSRSPSFSLINTEDTASLS